MQLFGKLPLDDFKQLSVLTKDLINENKTTNFVIIGASGFLGRWISSFLTYQQIHGDFKGTLSLIVRNPSKMAEFEDFPESIYRKVLQIDSLGPQSFKHFNNDRVVIYFAASSTTSVSLKFDKNASSAIPVAEKVMRYLPASQPIFIHLSSGGIYDPSARELTSIPSNYPQQLRSDNAYLEEKISLENWCRKQESVGRLTTRNPKLFSFYGPGLQLDRHFAIGEFMERARNGLTIQIKGNPNNLRSYLYPTDAIWQLLLQSSPTQPAHLQIGSAVPLQIQEIGRRIAEFYGVRLEICEGLNLGTDNYVPSDVPDKKERDLDSGIETWSQWLKN
jgi:dTDP-glucose 4,6-dehydratase